MTLMPQDFKNNFKTIGFFVFLNPFEILSHYPNLDSSRWFWEDVQWIIDEIFEEKIIVQMASTLSSRSFLLIFLVFACIRCCFHSCYFNDL